MTSLPGPEECFRQGIDARADGKRRADNPYDLGTPEHREWAAGWAATCDLDEDDDAQSTRTKPADTDFESDHDDLPGRRTLND